MTINAEVVFNMFCIPLRLDRGPTRQMWTRFKCTHSKSTDGFRDVCYGYFDHETTSIGSKEMCFDCRRKILRESRTASQSLYKRK